MAPITPRCLAGISPETLKKLIQILESDESNADNKELIEALNRLQDMAEKEIIQQQSDSEDSTKQ